MVVLIVGRAAPRRVEGHASKHGEDFVVLARDADVVVAQSPQLLPPELVAKVGEWIRNLWIQSVGGPKVVS